MAAGEAAAELGLPVAASAEACGAAAEVEAHGLARRVEAHAPAEGEGERGSGVGRAGELRAGELRRGVILGGGVALESRPIGLLIRPESQSVRTSAQVGAAINRRFHRTQRGVKAGVAVPKTDEFIDLVVHPRYKDNVYRYVDVLRSIPVSETTAQRQMRLRYLRQRLIDPQTAADAALQLEAIGIDSEPVLLHGLESADPEVRGDEPGARAAPQGGPEAPPARAALRRRGRGRLGHGGPI